MIPLIIAAAARVAGPMLARGAAAGAAEGGAASGAMSRVASAAAKMPMPSPGGGGEPRRPNFDAGKMSGGADLFSSMSYEQSAG